MPHVRIVLVCLSLLLSASGLASPQLTVAAAISLKPLLDEVLTSYRSNHQVDIRITYGASGVLSRQIAQGAPVDLMLSGAPEHIDALQKLQKTVPGSRLEIARGTMVLVTPRGKTMISRFEDLTQKQVTRIAIGDPKTVPAGSYAMEILTSLRISPGLGAKLIRAGHARQALAYVERGDVDAGIVYRSDALSSQQVRIAAEADPSWSRPVIYEAVIIQRSRDRAAAECLLHFLGSPVVKNALPRHGMTGGQT